MKKNKNKDPLCDYVENLTVNAIENAKLRTERDSLYSIIDCLTKSEPVYKYSSTAKEIKFPKASMADDATSAALYANEVYGMFENSQKDVLKANYVKSIVNCFTRAFATVYANECPTELVALCKENVENFVKHLEAFTKV